ncbi:MAG: SMP-30/gluconolactonase/LRE family protein [Acidobacteriota bacterium]
MMNRIFGVSLLGFLVLSCAPTTPAEETGPSPGAGTVTVNNLKFTDIVPADSRVEKIDEGFLFIEGPVWVKDPGYLLFSDVRGDAILKWAPGAQSEPFLTPVFNGPSPPEPRSIGPNGLTLDGSGNLVILETGNRRVARMSLGGGDRETLVERFQGDRFNSPNDLVYHSSGALYFTDPPYGLQGQDESPEKEIDFNGVYRLDPDGTLTVLTRELSRPNGLAFSPDEKILYIANTDPQQKVWMAYDVEKSGAISNGRVLFDATEITAPGGPDGMKLDATGNLYCTGPGGILILTPEGRHIGTIEVDEVPSNLAWGDKDSKTLYITARTGLYRIRLNIQGLLPVGVR